MAEYKCVNDFWVTCTDNERWDKEHKIIEAREDRNSSCMMFYKCDKDKNTCGFNASLKTSNTKPEVIAKKVEQVYIEHIDTNIEQLNKINCIEKSQKRKQQQVYTQKSLPGF